MTHDDSRIWRIGYRPIDRAKAKPGYWGSSRYETHREAAAEAGRLNHEYPQWHFFPDLVQEVREAFDDAEKP